MTSAMPLVYEEIKRDLLDRIGRQWAAGDRLPPAPALARELGAGQRNTLRAMQELVREGYLQSRPGRGTFVTRRLPEEQGTATLAAPATLDILLQAGGQDGFLFDIAESIRASVAPLDTKVQLRIVQGHLDLSLPPYCDADAVAIINPDRYLIQLRPHQAVVVVSSINTINVEALGGFDVVTIEEEHGGYLAGRHLRELGHESACFLTVRHKATPTVTDPIAVVRLRGFEAGFGRPVAAEHLLLCTAFHQASGAVAASRYHAMTNRPRAIFAPSDELAIGFAMGCLGQGLLPGRDFHLVGFDGQHRGRNLGECPPLTSVAIPSQEMGRRAVELLIDRLQRKDKPVERVLLGCSIYPGGTAGQSA